MNIDYLDQRLAALAAPDILDALPDGAYVTDPVRNIVFWNRAAERITGWRAADVVGHSCHDNILCHVDKDGHPLCGKEYCPLHRSILTGEASSTTLLVYAHGRDGRRIPVEVSVSPIRDREGRVIGGIELFRDLTTSMDDMVRAQVIQTLALETRLPEDARLEVAIRYRPHDLIGGDFYRVERIDADRYALMVADVMGHGVASALYTMQIRSVWNDLRGDLSTPGWFLSQMNHRLYELAPDAGYFATAALALLDAAAGTLRYIRAGHPSALLLRSGGAAEPLGRPQPALGMSSDWSYAESLHTLAAGDLLLLFSDGAVEIMDAEGRELDVDGLAAMLGRLALPGTNRFSLDALEEALLSYSSAIRLEDDLTLLAVRRADPA